MTILKGLHTVGTFKNFSATEILCEFDLTILESLNDCHWDKFINSEFFILVIFIPEKNAKIHDNKNSEVMKLLNQQF